MTGTITKTCIYCNYPEKLKNFSLEHIWPSALGGKLLPDLFKTRDVCKTCNNNCGLFVDGAFIKSLFVQHDIALTAHQYLTPKNITPVPFIYHGLDKNFPVSSREVCERWCGQAGEHIYFVRPKEDEKWANYVGGDMIKRKKVGYGRAYLVLTSSEPFWYITALWSFRKFFATAKRCLVTDIVVDDRDNIKSLIDFPDEEDVIQKQELTYIRGQKSKPFQTQTMVDIGSDDRFLYKISIALGYKLFGQVYGEADFTRELRRGLWTKEFIDRCGLDLRSKTSYQRNCDLGFDPFQYYGMKNMWTITVVQIGGCLSVILVSPSGRSSMSMITDDPTLYTGENMKKYRDGVSYFIIPELDIMEGAVGFSEILNHKLGTIKSSRLSRLEALQVGNHELPPKMNR